MNLKSNLISFGIIALLLQIFILMVPVVGAGESILVLALTFLWLAIKYLASVNPELYRLCSKKDIVFIRKKKRNHMIVFYLFAALNGFNAYRLFLVDDNTNLFLNFR